MLPTIFLASSPSLDRKPFHVILFSTDECHDAYAFLSLEISGDMILEITLPLVTFAVCSKNEVFRWDVSSFLGNRAAGGSVCEVKYSKFRV